MSKRATTYIIRFMVGTFKALKHLENLVPKQHSPHPVSKSQVAPMKILDVDEKYTQGNLDILDQLKKDTELCGDHQVIIVSLQPNVFQSPLLLSRGRLQNMELAWYNAINSC